MCMGRGNSCSRSSPGRSSSSNWARRSSCTAAARRSSPTSTSATEVVAERPGQDAAYVIDSERARKALGWRPRVTLDEGLVEVVEWVGANWEEIRTSPLTYEHKS